MFETAQNQNQNQAQKQAQKQGLNHTQIAAVFNGLFEDEHVLLQGGGNEPLYLPAQDDQPALIQYREDFAASALHEVAHWCVAGKDRRQLEDFGYTYLPPPRTQAQQEQFYRLELRTQCLESLFAEQAGVAFQVSADNLLADTRQFRADVETNRENVFAWMRSRRDDRAHRFYLALGEAHMAVFGDERQQPLEHIRVSQTMDGDDQTLNAVL